MIDTGARPKAPAIPGLPDVHPLTNETILELDVLPRHLLIIGGGFEGVEFAQMFRRFGSRVTIIQHGAQLLRAEDPDVADAVRQTFEREGIQVLLGTAAERAESSAGGVRLYLRPAGASEHSERQVVEGSHVLSVTGREPVTAELNVAATGLTVDEHGFIPVDEHLATAVPGWAPLDIGLTLAAIILFIGVATGGSVNPARAFGPDLVAAFFGFPVNWAAFVVSYLIGPLLGGVVGAFAYTAVAGLPRPSAATSVGGGRPQAGEAPDRGPSQAPPGLPAT